LDYISRTFFSVEQKQNLPSPTAQSTPSITEEEAEEGRLIFKLRRSLHFIHYKRIKYS